MSFEPIQAFVDAQLTSTNNLAVLPKGEYEGTLTLKSGTRIVGQPSARIWGKIMVPATQLLSCQLSNLRVHAEDGTIAIDLTDAADCTLDQIFVDGGMTQNAPPGWNYGEAAIGIKFGNYVKNHYCMATKCTVKRCATAWLLDANGLYLAGCRGHATCVIYDMPGTQLHLSCCYAEASGSVTAYKLGCKNTTLITCRAEAMSIGFDATDARGDILLINPHTSGLGTRLIDPNGHVTEL